MNTKAAIEQSSWDTAKLGLALMLLVAGIVAFHYFDDFSKLARVAGVIAAAGAALAIALQTAKGRQVLGFLHDAQIEVRKVVWPTRQETTQVTFIVIIVVIVFAIVLWVLDLLLGGLIQTIIGRGA